MPEFVGVPAFSSDRSNVGDDAAAYSLRGAPGALARGDILAGDRACFVMRYSAIERVEREYLCVVHDADAAKLSRYLEQAYELGRES